MGSMGTPHTFVDPVTSEEITVISEATAVDFTGHVSGANLEIDSIAPGYTDLGSAVGDIIVIRPTTAWADNIATVLAVAHSDTGAITDASVTTAKQKATTFSLGETNGIALNTNYQTVASVTLPAVSRAHKYLINSVFAISNNSSTTNLTYAGYIYEGANGIGYVYWDAPSGSYVQTAAQTCIFTSSASGGQTITFGLRNVSATTGYSSSAGSFTIVDLGCA